jgi:hypothetical protein
MAKVLATSAYDCFKTSDEWQSLLPFCKQVDITETAGFTDRGTEIYDTVLGCGSVSLTFSCSRLAVFPIMVCEPSRVETLSLQNDPSISSDKLFPRL